MNELRYFPHKLEDYSGSDAVVNEALLNKTVERYLHEIGDEDKLEGDALILKVSDIHSGCAGLAFMYYLLAKKDSNKSAIYYQHATQKIELALKIAAKETPQMKNIGKGFGFVCTTAGVLTVAALVYAATGQSTKAQEIITQITTRAKEAVQPDQQFENEYLYGRSGLLFCLALLIKNKVALASSLNPHAQKIIDAIWKDGATGPVLSWPWLVDGNAYIGAAHGSFGIIHTLLLFPDLLSEKIKKSIIATLDALVAAQLPNGNFGALVQYPTAGADLIQWCHGAVGAVITLSRAYQVFKLEQYKSALEKACRCIWMLGLLRKFPGICHGVPGNAYAFLAAYRITRDPKYLYRARTFCNVSLERNADFDATDEPFSFTAGMPGAVVFYHDILLDEAGGFPCFEVV
eukprot:TRINITY_DN14508_c0_g1_i1.p1 TRINITY_DN14508_c0_g1~~TRINITY_DN14508_c0_g1_i1.p1  ORF type:complete len:412 (+),score=60.96 TRINITY_DN14508_c0_g1_i1:25-1236(+)